MTVKEFLEQTLNLQMTDDEFYRRTRPRIFCKDGCSLSVQAKFGSYCKPMDNDLVDYESVELGFPSWLDYLDYPIMEYEDRYIWIENTMFAYVPVRLVDELLERHGGIDHFSCHY